MKKKQQFQTTFFKNTLHFGFFEEVSHQIFCDPRICRNIFISSTTLYEERGQCCEIKETQKNSQQWPGGKTLGLFIILLEGLLDLLVVTESPSEG